MSTPDAPQSPSTRPSAAETLQDGLVTDLVMLKSPTCAPCRIMGPRVEALLRDTAVTLIQLDVTEREGQDAMARFGDVRGVPTLIAVDSSGTEVRRHVGLATGEQLAALIQ